MKKNIWIRVLAALGGVSLWLLGLCALAETFFHVPVTGSIGQLLGAGKPLAVLAALLLAIALCAFGTCCLMMLSEKRATKRSGFVMQKGENGAIGVSVKSIEGLVQTCVRQHEVVESAEISVVERRDGIVILLNIREAAGVNIPLAVGALQKQIKQYVTDCTGVDVREVRVLVENTEESAQESPYAVKGPLLMATAHAVPEVQPISAEPVAEVVETVAAEEVPVEAEPVYAEEAAEEELVVEEAAFVEEPVPAPVVQTAPVVPVMPEIPEEEDDRPLHQRLFGAEEQPVFVPAPPELVAEPVVEEVAGEAAEQVEESAEETVEEAADAFDANAVLEVVEAIDPEAQMLLAEEVIVTDADDEDVPAEDEEKIPE